MGQLLNLIRLLNHIDRQRIFGCLVHLLFQIRRQRQQLIRVSHQPLLTVVVLQLRLLRRPQRVGGVRFIPESGLRALPLRSIWYLLKLLPAV